MIHTPSPSKPLLCPLCADTGGFIYIDESDRDKGVRACRHDGLDGPTIELG